MKGFGGYKKSKNKTGKHSNIENFKEEIISQAIQLHLNGNIAKAIKYYQQIINLGCTDQRVFLNYGVILKNYGKLKEAELSIRKAIKINPGYALAYSNLGTILKDLGKLEEAEYATR